MTETGPVQPSNFVLPEQLDAVEEPHPDYGGWHNFLRDHTTLRDQHEGVLYFGATNCNYVVFPSGLLVQNFGYHGRALMNEVKEAGVAVVEQRLRAHRAKTAKLLAEARQPSLTAADIQFVDGSTINEFDFGVFKGHADRKDAKKEKWDPHLQAMQPAVPAHWAVTIYGENNAWLELRVPLKRGRQLRQAVFAACRYVGYPDKIQLGANGQFGSVMDLPE